MRHLVLVALCVPGCLGGAPPDRTCTDNASCAAGQVCAVDGCFTICNFDRDCPSTDICDQGRCVAGTRSGPHCGDGATHGAEACDAGRADNDGEYGGCNPDCTRAPHCGDGVLAQDEGELCDDGTDNDGSYDGCKLDCTLAPRCGDGVRQQPQEDCDDGNTTTEACAYGFGSCVVCGPSCDWVSATGPYCGDDVVDDLEGETCDDGNVTLEPCPYGVLSCQVCGPGCVEADSTGGFCGDGRVTDGEVCDDGGTVTETGCAYGVTSCTGCRADCGLVLNLSGGFCGDGSVDGPEVCDQLGGDRTADGACNQGCTGTVQTKVIQRIASTNKVDGALGGISGADAICVGAFGAGYKAFLSDGVNRRATVTGNLGDSPIDWVLRPYTRYVNASAQLVWFTYGVPLLGVGEDGLRANLLAAIATDDGWGSWTGMANDYTASVDCSDWGSASSGVTGRSGNQFSTGLGLFPNNGTSSTCNNTRHILCVQQ